MVCAENEGFTKTLAENIFIKPFKEAAAAKSSVEIHAKRSFNKPFNKPFNKTFQQNLSRDLG